MLNKTLIVLSAMFLCAYTNAQIDFGNALGTGGPVTPTQSQTPNTYTVPGNYDNSKIDYVNSVVHKVEETQNFINLGNLSPDSNVALPFGIIKDIGAVRYVVAVDSLKFKPDGAFFSAYASIDFPGTTKRMACLKAINQRVQLCTITNPRVQKITLSMHYTEGGYINAKSPTFL